MTDTKAKIVAGLERAFAAHGFAGADIETLREAAGVSLRTLYKYFPTPESRMLAALEHRHQRYLARVAKDLPRDPAAALPEIFDRIGAWMQEEASHGCLFHAAVAAAPGNQALRDMLSRHKEEVSSALSAAIGRPDLSGELMLLMEGLTQSWPLQGRAAVATAQRLGTGMLAAAAAE